MDQSKSDGGELLPLRRMAARLGVPSRWLKEQAENGTVPSLKAGKRFLFAPNAVRTVVAAMAERGSSQPEGGSKC
ncbi:MAG: hypothetical protein RLZZ396_3213 [Planctomycetota bacterium]|jgi:hypothetical protein